MAKKLLKPKRGKVENLSKLAVEDGALVFAYDTKATTSTVLVDIGDTRYDLAAGAAKKADNADALGGSSLQNIIDKINNSTGEGAAFTALDATTNDKVKLTRANGVTVEKVINNVAMAATADYAKGGESESNYQLNSAQLHQTIDLSGSTYNQDTWYPVIGSVLPYRGYSRIICYVQLNSGTKPSWSTHNSGFTCNLDILAKASGQNTTNGGTIVLDYSWGYIQDNISPISYQQLTNSSYPVIWMRGGGKYFIRSSEKFTWEVKTGSYTTNSQTIAPQTSCPELSLTRSTIYADINGFVAKADSATNASTAEYAEDAGKLGGVEADKYAKKEDIPVIPSNLDVANRLQSYASGGNIPNSLFYRYGVLNSSWNSFPASSLPSTGVGTNFQGKNTGVLHIAAGSSYHDLAFTAGAADNQGILYAGTGRNPAYILDTENYKTKGNVFNSLTANTSFTAKVNVTIDGGSY